MVVEKVLEKNSLRQSKWLEKCISFNSKKQNYAKYDFKRDFYKALKNSLYGKQWKMLETDKVWNLIPKKPISKIIRQQSLLAFTGIHKPYEIYVSYIVKQNEVLMDTPI